MSEQISVMVVDDHPMWRDGVSRDLEGAGFTVVATAEGDAAAIETSELTPEDDAAVVVRLVREHLTLVDLAVELSARGHKVLMIGDGLKVSIGKKRHALVRLG